MVETSTSKQERGKNARVVSRYWGSKEEYKSSKIKLWNTNEEKQTIYRQKQALFE